MPSLTDSFHKYRNNTDRLRKLVVFSVVFVIVAGAGAAAFFLYQDKDQGDVSAEESYSILPSWWLMKYFGTDDENSEAVGGIYGDPDGDFLTNYQEYYFGTDPTKADTSGDGIDDSLSILIGLNPITGEKMEVAGMQRTSEAYLRDHNLEEFTKENIEAKISALFSSVDESSVELYLPPLSQFSMTSDSTDQSIENYLRSAHDATARSEFNPSKFRDSYQNRDFVELQSQAAKIYETIDRLKTVTVPAPFLTYHQLTVASLFVSAEAIQAALDPRVIFSVGADEEQFQKGYTDYLRIQKITQMAETELARLHERYGQVIVRFQNSL